MGELVHPRWGGYLDVSWTSEGKWQRPCFMLVPPDYGWNSSRIVTSYRGEGCTRIRISVHIVHESFQWVPNSSSFWMSLKCVLKTCSLEFTRCVETNYLVWLVSKSPTKAGAVSIQYIDNFKDTFMSFQITNCPWWMRCPKESLMAESCLWETSISSDSTLPDCQANHGICMKTPSGNCGWSTDKKYRECMKNRRRIREEKLRKEPWTTQRNSSWIMICGHWY
jgi:hypothetical protein